MWAALRDVIQTAAVTHLFFTHVLGVKLCSGESMLPEIAASGDIVVINHLPVYFPRLTSPWARGDMVLAQHPFSPTRLVGKRIIGLPGDTIEVNPGVVRPWVDDARGGKEGVQQRYIKVPPGHVWVQGDNLSNSTDSRDYGPLPMALLMGRIWGRIWPWTSRQVFPPKVRWLDDAPAADSRRS